LRRSSSSQARCGFSTERRSPPVGKAGVRLVSSKALHPADRACDSDPEYSRRLVPRKAVLDNGLDHPNAKSLSMCHPRRPPLGRKDESCSARFGNPL
jgi:hypothetical protein